MKNCEGCFSYDKEYDNLRMRFNDALIEGKEKCHFCIMFESGIPNDIWHNKKECPEKLSKE